MDSVIRKCPDEKVVGLNCLLIFVLFISSFFELNAQFIPSFCNESPRSRWFTYMDWIKPTAPVLNGLICNYQLYNLPNISLSATGILSNTNNLIGTGLVQFIKGDRLGNSCLAEKSSRFQNSQTCTTEVKKVSAIFGVGGQPTPNQGLIKINDIFYKYVSSSGDVHSFKRENASEILVIHIKKSQIF